MRFAPSSFAIAVALAALAPDVARACGGFFCSSGPVDQAGENILFEVNLDGSVTAVVEVSYNGDPADFSWVVPVPETPTIDVVPALVLDILAQRTQPRVVAPSVTTASCDQGEAEEIAEDFYEGGGGGCFGPSSAPAPRAQGGSTKEDDRPSLPDDAPPPDVHVQNIPRVGPYDDIVVVDSTDPDAMIAWLNDNGYVITTAMEPYVRMYVDEGQKFLALKLAPDSGVQDIAPIRFTCPNGFPTIPLRLTAVAAEPGMRITTWIVGADNYLPTSYRLARVDVDDVRFQFNGFRQNYDALLALAVHDEGGQAFVVERAGATTTLRDDVASVTPSNDDESAAQAWVVDLLTRNDRITRFGARMLASSMTEDPVFMPAAVDDFDGVYDLSTSRPPLDVCEDDLNEIVPCGFSYCGGTSRCAVNAGGDEGCECASGTVARQVRTPDTGAAVVMCQERDDDHLGRDRLADPCTGFSCGAHGTCVPINGFPTCSCDEGFVAYADATRPNGVVCGPAEHTYDVERLRARSTVVAGAVGETTSAAVRAPRASCASSRRGGNLVELAALLVALLVARRFTRR